MRGGAHRQGPGHHSFDHHSFDHHSFDHRSYALWLVAR